MHMNVSELLDLNQLSRLSVASFTTLMSIIYYLQQSVLQTIENDESADLILMIVNLFIHEIFGDEDQVLNSFFLHTTPRKFLFEGVKFCQHDTPAAELVCSIVRQEESASIIDAYPEPGLLFSMFNHVSFIV